jgi:hypothetical protein
VKNAGNLQIILVRFFSEKRGKAMIHKKSCFGRTFEQDAQASEPEGKSWSDDKFYENLKNRMKSKPPEPLWQPQWNKPVVEKLAWWPMSEEEYLLHKQDYDFDPSWSALASNIYHKH